MGPRTLLAHKNIYVPIFVFNEWMENWAPKRPCVWASDNKDNVVLSCLTLCDPTDYGPPGSSFHEIPQARTLGLGLGVRGRARVSRVAFPTPGDLPHTGIKFASPASAGRFFTIEPPGNPNEDNGEMENHLPKSLLLHLVPNTLFHHGPETGCPSV